MIPSGSSSWHAEGQVLRSGAVIFEISWQAWVSLQIRAWLKTLLPSRFSQMVSEHFEAAKISLVRCRRFFLPSVCRDLIERGASDGSITISLSFLLMLREKEMSGGSS